MQPTARALLFGALVPLASLTLPSLASSSVAHAENLLEDPALHREVTDISTELLDPAGYSRFHLVSRASFSDGRSVFSHDQTWSYEARLDARITRGLALSVTLPFGLLAARGLDNTFFFGNFSLGVAGGGQVHLLAGTEDRPASRLRIGGAFEVYAPTAPKPGGNTTLALAEGSVAAIRVLEPWLYLGEVMAFRARVRAGLNLGIVTASVEGGIIPGFSVTASPELLAWGSLAGRLSMLPAAEVEPFVEAGTSFGLTSNLSGSAPLFLTPGVRLHFGSFDPALFASIRLSNTAVVVFGVDLAGVLIPSARGTDRDHDDLMRFE